MVLWLQLFKRFLSFYWQVRLFAVTQASPDRLPESGDRHFLPKPFGSIFFLQSVDFPPSIGDAGASLRPRTLMRVI